jgi:cyclin-dependent kinase-like
LLIQKIIYKTVKAIHFLHLNNVAHRDIKPENLLINRNRHGIELKLCDFGFTRFMNRSAGEHLTDYVATRWYRSP